LDLASIRRVGTCVVRGRRVRHTARRHTTRHLQPDASDFSSLIGDDILEHGEIELNVKSTGTHRGHLTKHDVFGNTLAVILVTLRSCLHENLDSLFERGLGKCTSVRSVDTMTSDGHELSSLSH
jgi:hypothetical protein